VVFCPLQHIGFLEGAHPIAAELTTCGPPGVEPQIVTTPAMALCVRVTTCAKSSCVHQRAAAPLAFTRYCFTSSRSCTNQSSFHSSGPPALPTLLQYYCTAIGQYTTPHPTPLVYAIHHTILAMAISCKCQAAPLPACCPLSLSSLYSLLNSIVYHFFSLPIDRYLHI